MHQWRNFVSFLLISLVILSLINHCTRQNPYTDVNSPPNIPNIVFPPQDTIHVNVDIELRWGGGDPNPSDIVTYDLFLEAGNPSPHQIVNNLSSSKFRPDSLAFSTTYYWQIIATDDHGASTVSPLWSFTTRSNTNAAPFAPEYLAPSNNTTFIEINDAALSWTGGDPDTLQTVTYKVLWDTKTPPSFVLLDQ
jgi:hypothetical protein